MAANKLVRFGPVALSATLTTNILNPGTTTGGVGMPATSTNLYFLLRHIRIVNKTAGAVTASLYIGATGGNVAGTEFLGTAISIAANSSYDWYGLLRLDVADFLVGGASAGTSLTFEAEGEIGVAG
jgi:hypothetical protein